MLRIFLDTDVLLDIILERGEHSSNALQVLALQDDNKAVVFTSSLNLANIAYFSRKFGKDPFQVIRSLLKWIRVIDLEKKHFELVVNSNFKDFEDGLQYYASLEIDNIDAIITRNSKDYKSSTIPVFTPQEFVKSLE